MAGTVRESSEKANEQSVRLLCRVLSCDRLLDSPIAPWPWHAPRLVVGRGEKTAFTADRLSLDDKRVSVEHAALELKGDAVWVTDLGSSNGTLVDGERIK